VFRTSANSTVSLVALLRVRAPPLGQGPAYLRP
jgi:hypothetical protein